MWLNWVTSHCETWLPHCVTFWIVWLNEPVVRKSTDILLEKINKYKSKSFRHLIGFTLWIESSWFVGFILLVVCSLYMRNNLPWLNDPIVLLSILWMEPLQYHCKGSPHLHQSRLIFPLHGVESDSVQHHKHVWHVCRFLGVPPGRGSCPLTGPLPFDLIYTDYHGLQQMKQHMGLSLRKHKSVICSLPIALSLILSVSASCQKLSFLFPYQVSGSVIESICVSSNCYSEETPHYWLIGWLGATGL